MNDDRVHGIQAPYSVYERTANDSSTILVIVTTHGIVMAYVGHGYTELRFAHNGALHTRYHDREFRPRYVITLANRFINEIMKGEEDDERTDEGAGDAHD